MERVKDLYKFAEIDIKKIIGNRIALIVREGIKRLSKVSAICSKNLTGGVQLSGPLFYNSK
jgi:hypothetical protein